MPGLKILPLAAAALIACSTLATAEDLRIALGCAGFVHAGGSARENDSLGLQLTNPLSGDVVANDLAVDILFANSAGDELRVLGSEVEDQDSFLGGGFERRDTVGAVHGFALAWAAASAFSKAAS